MDKTISNNTRVSYKKGFALLITLSVLSVIIALTLVMLGYFSKVKEDVSTTKALIQGNVYYADILKQFDKLQNKKTIFNYLYKSSLSLRIPDGRFFVTLSCRPISTGININWLGLENNTGQQLQYNEAENIFEALTQAYRLEDVDRLKEMILFEIGKGKKFIQHEQSRLRQKDGIISYKQFSDIVSRYQLEVDDPKASQIAWNRYFSFSGKAQKVNAEYSSPELISLMFDIDLPTVKEWYHLVEEKPSLSTFVDDNGGDYKEKSALISGFLAEALCTVRYGAGYRFTFEYIEGVAKHFEFYGKH